MPTFLITGATGTQGGSVAYALLESGKKVHALVRDPTKPASLALKAAGATLFQGSFSDIPSIEAAAQGADGVFVNVMPDFIDVNSERQNAKNVIQAAKQAGVKHIIYTSVLKTGKHESFPNWEQSKDSFMGNYWLSKNDIEGYTRGAGFESWTILRPGFFMTNLFPPIVAHMFPELWPEGVLKSGYSKTTTLSLVDPRDIGRAAAKVWEEPGKWNGKAIDVYSSDVSLPEVVKTLSEVSGRKFEVGELVEAEVEGFRKRLFESQKLLAGIQQMGEKEGDLQALLELGVKPRSFKEYLEERKEKGTLSG